MFKIDTFLFLMCVVIAILAMVAGENIISGVSLVIAYGSCTIMSYMRHGEMKRNAQEIKIWVGMAELTKSVLQETHSGIKRAREQVKCLETENTDLKGQIVTLKSVIKKAGMKTEKTKKKNVKK